MDINEWASDLKPWERETLRKADDIWDLVSRHTKAELEEIRIYIDDNGAFCVSIRHEAEEE